MTDKEQIKCNYKFQDKEGFDSRPYCACFDRLCEDLFLICDHNCQVYEDFKQLARKTKECEEKDERIIELTKEGCRLKQECEELEDFRTLVREPFAFGDSDVDDESFIKYLNKYVTDMTEALESYQKLTDILEIDWTIHGPYDIEEIIKQVTELKQECEELKSKNSILKNSLKPFQDEYFKNLETIVIAGLAKKSIRITAENTQLCKAIEEIEDICKVADRYELEELQETIFNIINKAKGEG